MGIEYEKELYSRIETLRSELEAEYEKVKKAEADARDWKSIAELNAATGRELGARAEKAEAEVRRLRQYIAEVHNKVRHELSAEIEAATDKAFRALSGTQVLSLIPK